MTMTTQSLAERLEEKTALSKLEEICAEIYDTWDKDQRPGKLLLALAGLLPNYRQDVDDVRSALRSRDSVEPAAYLLENRAYGKELRFKPLDAMRGPGWGQTPLYALSSHAETAGGWVLVAKNADGEVRAMMRLDGDDCLSVAETLREWHAVDAKRTLHLLPASAMIKAAKGDEI